jgi:hypothetical protein
MSFRTWLVTLVALCACGEEVTVVALGEVPLREGPAADAPVDRYLQLGWKATAKLPSFWQSKGFWQIRPDDGAKLYAAVSQLERFPIASKPMFVAARELVVQKTADIQSLVKTLEFSAAVSVNTDAAWLSQGSAAVIEDGTVIGFVKASELVPEKPDPKNLLPQAVEALRKQDLATAMTIADLIVRFDPKNDTGLRLRAAAAEVLGDPRAVEWRAEAPTSDTPAPALPVGKAYVTTVTLTVRAEPAWRGATVADLAIGSEVMINEVAGSWAKIGFPPELALAPSLLDAGHVSHLPLASGASKQPSDLEPASSSGFVPLSGLTTTQPNAETTRAAATQEPKRADLLARALVFDPDDQRLAKDLLEAALREEDFENAVRAVAVLAQQGRSAASVDDVHLVHGCRGDRRRATFIRGNHQQLEDKAALPDACVEAFNFAVDCDKTHAELDSVRRRIDKAFPKDHGLLFVLKNPRFAVMHGVRLLVSTGSSTRILSLPALGPLAQVHVRLGVYGESPHGSDYKWSIDDLTKVSVALVGDDPELATSIRACADSSPKGYFGDVRLSEGEGGITILTASLLEDTRHCDPLGD